MKFLTIILMLASFTRMFAQENVQHPYFAQSAKALVTADGKKAAQDRLLKPPYTLIYFSAHWCPPCRTFTPDLVKFYNENGGGEKFEVLFVSSDEDGVKMLGYMKEMTMPWIALTFGSSKTNEIKKKYGGEGIPCLTVVDGKDEVVFHSYVEGEYVGPRHVLDQFKGLLDKK